MAAEAGPVALALVEAAGVTARVLWPTAAEADPGAAT